MGDKLCGWLLNQETFLGRGGLRAVLRGRLQMVPPLRGLAGGDSPSLAEIILLWLCSGGGKPNVSGQRTSQGQTVNEIDVLLSYFIKRDCKVWNTWDEK